MGDELRVLAVATLRPQQRRLDHVVDVRSTDVTDPDLTGDRLVDPPRRDSPEPLEILEVVGRRLGRFRQEGGCAKHRGRFF